MALLRFSINWLLNRSKKVRQIVEISGCRPDGVGDIFCHDASHGPPVVSGCLWGQLQGCPQTLDLHLRPSLACLCCIDRLLMVGQSKLGQLTNFCQHWITTNSIISLMQILSVKVYLALFQLTLHRPQKISYQVFHQQYCAFSFDFGTFQLRTLSLPCNSRVSCIRLSVRFKRFGPQNVLFCEESPISVILCEFQLGCRHSSQNAHRLRSDTPINFQRFFRFQRERESVFFEKKTIFSGLAQPEFKLCKERQKLERISLHNYIISNYKVLQIANTIVQLALSGKQAKKVALQSIDPSNIYKDDCPQSCRQYVPGLVGLAFVEPSDDLCAIVDVSTLDVQAEVSPCKQNRIASALCRSLAWHYSPFMGVSVCVVLNIELVSRLSVIEVWAGDWTVVSKVNDGEVPLVVGDEPPSLVVSSMILVKDEVSIITVAILVDAVKRVYSRDYLVGNVWISSKSNSISLSSKAWLLSVASLLSVSLLSVASRLPVSLLPESLLPLPISLLASRVPASPLLSPHKYNVCFVSQQLKLSINLKAEGSRWNDLPGLVELVVAGPNDDVGAVCHVPSVDVYSQVIEG